MRSVEPGESPSTSRPVGSRSNPNGSRMRPGSTPMLTSGRADGQPAIDAKHGVAAPIEQQIVARRQLREAGRLRKLPGDVGREGRDGAHDFDRAGRRWPGRLPGWPASVGLDAEIARINRQKGTML